MRLCRRGGLRKRLVCGFGKGEQSLRLEAESFKGVGAELAAGLRGKGRDVCS